MSFLYHIHLFLNWKYLNFTDLCVDVSTGYVIWRLSTLKWFKLCRLHINRSSHCHYGVTGRKFSITCRKQTLH